jgi:outer membrane cobalamin receptor
MILNSTPGVYATQSGGGDGDARITIRGFNQRNVAVMIDGIPVNDMENGWVYWSNWFGLDAVTSNIQVQRGLGASKIAIPSVGGTMNILTKGTGNKSGGTIKQELGSFGKLRTSLGYNTGKLKNGWGLTLSGSNTKLSPNHFLIYQYYTQVMFVIYQKNLALVLWFHPIYFLYLL